MKKHLRFYSTLLLLTACFSAGLSASGMERAISSNAWLLSKRSQPGTILFNGQWYLPHELSAALTGGRSHMRSIFATCGGTVGGTGLNDDFDGDGVCNVNDIDDDNDGIIDALESPGCFYTAAEAGVIAVVKTPLANDDGQDVNLPFMHDGVTTSVSASNNVISINQAVNGAVIYGIDYNTPVRLTSVSVYGTTWGTGATAMLQGSNDNLTWDNMMTAATAATANPKTFTVNNNVSTSYQYYRLVKVAGTTTPAVTSYEVSAVQNVTGYNASAHPKPTCVNDLDADTFANHQDPDSDGDGCSDSFEAGAITTEVANHQFSGSDANEDGLVDSVDGVIIDGNPEYTYKPYAYNANLNFCTDTDNDGVTDLVDIDDDNDGILDSVECPAAFTSLLGTSGGFTTDPPASNWYYSNSTSNYDAAGNFPFGYGSTQANSNNTGGLFDELNGNNASTGTLNALMELNGATDALVSRLNQQLVAGVTYRFSFDAGLRGGSGVVGQNCRLWLYNADANSVQATLASVPLNSLPAFPAYQTISGSFTVPTNGNYYLLFMNAGDGGAANDYNVDRVALVGETANPVICDADGDGIPNYLDLDSDGDGCPDAVEAGVSTNAGASGSMSSSGGTLYTGGIPSGTANAYVGNGSNAQYGANGFFNGIETSSESGSYNSGYTYSYALSNAINLCTDTDGDGIKDFVDIDDDNDGVTDATESPNCFYTQAEASAITVTSELNQYMAGYEITRSYDKNTTTQSAFATGQNWVGKSVFEITPGTAVAISAVNFDIGSWYLSAGSAASTFKLQGWTGAAWEDLSAPMSNYNSTADFSISNTLHPASAYAKYRIVGVAGTCYYSGVNEITLTMNNYVPSAHPKLTCSNDTDGDGIPNHLDLDSDGDGCSDLMEAGVSPATDVITPGSTNAEGGSYGISNPAGSQLNPTATDANNDGLNDSVDAGQDGTPDYTSTYLQYALAPNIRACDYDGDGVSDLVDLDDDNDGILDAVESPSCYFTATEANVVTKISSQFTSPDDDQTDGDIQLLHDGATTLTFNFDAFTAVNNPTGSNLFTIEYPTPVTLATLVISDNISATASANAIVVGSNDGVTWSAALSPATVITTTPVTFNITTPQGYKYYRIQTGSVAGALAAANTIGEITSTLATGYVPSAHPKPTCTADTDGDGIVNHLDLDSDGDGCPDATEGGGGFTTGDLEESSLAGGNSGTGYTGAVTFGVDDNLGNTVDANGVPTIANGGQALGQSQTAGTPCAEIEPCALTISGVVYEDRDGASNGVSGTPYIKSQLYVALVSGGAVQSVATVGADGAYSFTGVTGGTYELVLTTNAAGSVIATLPGGVVPVAEGGAVNGGTGLSMGDGNANSMTSMTMTCQTGNAHVDFGIDSSLPVTLISLTASQATEGTLLEWLTADEKDFDRFEIEQSAMPQIGFAKIGEVKGGGSKYTFVDAVKRNGASYYRLKMVDTDGSYSYSRIVTVTRWDGKELNRVYPNPAIEGRISINSIAPIESWKVYDVNGNTVKVQMSAQNGTYRFTFGKDVQPGIYVIKYRAGGHTLTQQFVLVR